MQKSNKGMIKKDPKKNQLSYSSMILRVNLRV